MTQAEKLEALIRKTIDNGYQPLFWTSLNKEEPGEFVKADDTHIYWQVPGKARFRQSADSLIHDPNFLAHCPGEGSSSYGK